MKIRKFFAGSSRDALRLVREALGPDAVVLSNRAVEGGVELVALAENDLATLATPTNLGGMSAALGLAQAQEAPQRLPSQQHPQQQSQPQPRAQAQPPAWPATAPRTQARAPQPAGPEFAPRALPDPFQATFGHSGDAGFEPASPRADWSRPPRETPITPAVATARGLGAPAREIIMPSSARAEALEQGRPMARPAAQAGAVPLMPATERAMANPPPAYASALDAPAPAAPAFAPAFVPANASDFAAHSPGHLAAPAAAHFSAQQPRQPAPLPPAKSQPLAAVPTPATPVPMSIAAACAQTPAPEAPVPEAASARAPGSEASLSQVGQLGQTGPAPAVAAAVTQEIQAQLARILAQDVIGEIHSLRGALEEQLSTLMWNDRQRRDPVRAQVTKTLLASGFSAQLVRLLIERMPVQPGHAQAMEWVKDALARNLPVLESEDTLMERGGVYALTGPTGVGKTTTTAKLAARCVMRYGADRVALLTTDSYRIGAHEQLRIYGKILGVGVHAVKDVADLNLALSELRNKHIVLIDTIGMSQRDRNVAEQVAMLRGSALPVQRLLLLNATSHGDTLNEVVHAYRNRPGAGGADLAGCILTKLDEATNIGAVLDTVVRYRLPVHYVSTGQKVPENLYVASKPFLLKSAFCIPRENSPFVPHEEDFPALMAGVPARALADLSEVRFG